MRDLRNRLYAHLETLPLSFFTNTKTGELVSWSGAGLKGVGYTWLSSSTGMVRTPAVWRAYPAKPA
jgi:ABC-type multidrug transport system fused ATPase/permease subunit